MPNKQYLNLDYLYLNQGFNIQLFKISLMNVFVLEQNLWVFSSHIPGSSSKRRSYHRRHVDYVTPVDEKRTELIVAYIQFVIIEVNFGA